MDRLSEHNGCHILLVFFALMLDFGKSAKFYRVVDLYVFSKIVSSQ